MNDKIRDVNYKPHYFDDNLHENFLKFSLEFKTNYLKLELEKKIIIPTTNCLSSEMSRDPFFEGIWT